MSEFCTADLKNIIWLWFVRILIESVLLKIYHSTTLESFIPNSKLITILQFSGYRLFYCVIFLGWIVQKLKFLFILEIITEVDQADRGQGHGRMKGVGYHQHIYLVQKWWVIHTFGAFLSSHLNSLSILKEFVLIVM